MVKIKGEKVSVDEPVVELETDKVNVEVPAPTDGILESISVNEGETVNVGAILGSINGKSKTVNEDFKEVKNIHLQRKKLKFQKNQSRFNN